MQRPVTIYTYEQLDKLTKPQLLVIAESQGITLLSNANLKADIINGILGVVNNG